MGTNVQVDQLDVSVCFYGYFPAGHPLVGRFGRPDGGGEFDAQSLPGHIYDIARGGAAGGFQVFAGAALDMQNSALASTRRAVGAN